MQLIDDVIHAKVVHACVYRRVAVKRGKAGQGRGCIDCAVLPDRRVKGGECCVGKNTCEGVMRSEAAARDVREPEKRRAGGA